MSKILVSASAFIMLVTAPSVQADPVVPTPGFITVTSGFVSVTGLAGGPTLPANVAAIPNGPLPQGEQS